MLKNKALVLLDEYDPEHISDGIAQMLGDEYEATIYRSFQEFNEKIIQAQVPPRFDLFLTAIWINPKLSEDDAMRAMKDQFIHHCSVPLLRCATRMIGIFVPERVQARFNYYHHSSIPALIVPDIRTVEGGRDWKTMAELIARSIAVTKRETEPVTPHEGND